MGNKFELIQIEEEIVLKQGSQTHGPQASCGPPDVFMLPALSSKFP